MRSSTRAAMLLCSTAPSTAIPTARPSWRAVLLMPEASPPCAGGSTPRCAKVASGLASPVPAPTATRPASRCTHDESASTPVISSSPPAVRPIPSASVPVNGARPVSRPATSELAKADERERRQPQPDLDRAAAGDLEQEQRQVDEDAERAARQRDDDHRRAEERAVAEQAQVEHRVGVTQLDADERRQRHEPGGHAPEHRRARPPQRVAAQHREDDQEEARRQRHHAAPSRSGSGRGRATRRTLVSASPSVGSPSTTPSQKIACQPKLSTSSPPTSGPAANASPMTAPHDPDRAGARGPLELLRPAAPARRGRASRRRAPAAPAPRSAAPTTTPARTAPTRW